MFSHMERAPTCPTCKRPLKTDAENLPYPFCSRRCKLADLSNWFNERYTVPAEGLGQNEDDGSNDPVLN
jgi:endogenous inhibitor of DNA gyrase (YacG/DUF329 family)